jgi:dihydroxy-acid dehydratase
MEARGDKAYRPENRKREISKALKAYSMLVSSADKGGIRLI